MTSATLEAGVRATPRGPTRARRRLLVRAGVVQRAILLGLLAAALFWPSYSDTSRWLGVGIALTVFVVYHGAAAAYEVPWIPGIVAMGACVQWVLAPWFVYLVQGSYRVSRMAVEPTEYFSVAVPATVALVVGMYIPLWRQRLPRTRVRATQIGPASLRRFRMACDAMVGAGLFIRLFVLPLTPVSVRFALYLVSLLAFVGALGITLSDARGWYWRVAAVLGVAAVSNAASLQFLELLLWAGCIGCVLCYHFRPRAATLAAFLVPAVLLFTAINAFKMLHRDEIRGMGLEANDRAAITSTTVIDIASDPSTALGSANLVATISRLNEGFVLSRIYAWVPLAEPYARGETIVTAFRSAFVPRLLDPGKYVAGGAEIVPRFTGLELINSTSISLSIPGEMYANFGRLGSWLGTFVAGVVIGWIFLLFLRRGQVSPMWWAWAPFVLFGVLSAEQSVGEIVNSITKAAFVMLVAVRSIPAWRTLPRSWRALAVARPETAGRTVAIAAND